MLSQERDDLPAIEVDPRAFAAGVVAAGQPGHIEGETQTPDLRDHFAREMGGERQVVPRCDEAHGARALAREALGEG